MADVKTGEVGQKRDSLTKPTEQSPNRLGFEESLWTVRDCDVSWDDSDLIVTGNVVKTIDLSDATAQGAIFDKFIAIDNLDSVLRFTRKFGLPKIDIYRVNPIIQVAQTIYTLEVLREEIASGGERLDLLIRFYKYRGRPHARLTSIDYVYGFDGSIPSRVELQRLPNSKREQMVAAAGLLAAHVDWLLGDADIRFGILPIEASARVQFLPTIKISCPWAAVVYHLLMRCSEIEDVRSCKECGEVFIVVRSHQRECSAKCKKRRQRREKVENEVKGNVDRNI